MYFFLQIQPGGGRFGLGFGVNGEKTFPDTLQPPLGCNFTFSSFAFALGVPLLADLVMLVCISSGNPYKRVA